MYTIDTAVLYLFYVYIAVGPVVAKYQINQVGYASQDCLAVHRV